LKPATFRLALLIVGGEDGNMAPGVKLVVQLKEETLVLLPYTHKMVDKIVLDHHLWLKLATFRLALSIVFGPVGAVGQLAINPVMLVRVRGHVQSLG